MAIMHTMRGSNFPLLLKDTKNINIGGAGPLAGHRARKGGCGRKKKVAVAARLRCRYWCFYFISKFYEYSKQPKRTKKYFKKI